MLTLCLWNSNFTPLLRGFVTTVAELSIRSNNEKIKNPPAFGIFMSRTGSNGRGKIGPAYKSWGEEQIARLLDKNQIAYQYEYPLAVIDRGKTRLNYPDFRLKDFGIIIEYFGVNGNSNYDEQAQHKIEVYKQAGIEGLFLTRDSLRGNWPEKILGQIEGVLRGRMDRFYDRCQQNKYR